MPIKFRCDHCHQLMGIARRKAGSQVQCPSCRKAVTVPVDDVGESPLPAAAAAPAGAAAGLARAAVPTSPKGAPAGLPPGLFEQNDIDELLRAPRADRGEKPAAAQLAPAAAGTSPAPVWSSPAPAPGSYDVEPVSANGQSLPGLVPVGFVVTPRRATLLIIADLLLLAAAFAAGIYVGMRLL